MAIRLTTDRIASWFTALVCVICAGLVLGLFVTFVGALSCATMDNRGAEIKGVDVSKTSTTTTTVPVSVGDVDGPVTVITLAGATPWTIAGLVGLLGLFQARRQSTATGALDRVMLYLKLHRAAARRGTNFSDAKALKAVTRGIEAAGTLRGKPDRLEHCLRSRLAKMKPGTSKADTWMAKVRAWGASFEQKKHVVDYSREDDERDG